jgi:hypothetical protein
MGTSNSMVAVTDISIVPATLSIIFVLASVIASSVSCRLNDYSFGFLGFPSCAWYLADRPTLT